MFYELTNNRWQNHNKAKQFGKRHTKTQNLNVSSSHFDFVIVHYIEAKCKIKNEDVFGKAAADDAPTTSWWSTILLPTEVTYIRGLTVRFSQNTLSSWGMYRHLLYMDKIWDVITHPCPEFNDNLS